MRNLGNMFWIHIAFFTELLEWSWLWLLTDCYVYCNTRKKNIMFLLCFMKFRWQHSAAVVKNVTLFSPIYLLNDSILLWISLEKTRNIIATLFIIPHVKTSQQTFNRILLWIVWSVGRVWSCGVLFSVLWWWRWTWWREVCHAQSL